MADLTNVLTKLKISSRPPGCWLRETGMTQTEVVRFMKVLIISSSEIVETSSELISTSSELISTGSELISTGSELILTGSELIRTSAELIFPTSRPAAIHGRIGRHAGCACFALFCFPVVRCFNIYHSGSSIFLRHCYRKKKHPEQYAAILLRVKWVKGAKASHSVWGVDVEKNLHINMQHFQHHLNVIYYVQTRLSTVSQHRWWCKCSRGSNRPRWTCCPHPDLRP